MSGFLVTLVAGIVCIVLGISNMGGNISSIHSYHRARVSEADRLPFGRQVGLGTIIVGIGIVAFSILSAVTHYTENPLFGFIGIILLLLGLLVGLALSFHAMIKYNKGIF